MLPIALTIGINHYTPYIPFNKPSCHTHIGHGPTNALLAYQPAIGFPILVGIKSSMLSSITFRMGLEPTIEAPRMQAKTFFLKKGYRTVFNYTEWAYLIGLDIKTPLLPVLGFQINYLVFNQPGKLSFDPFYWKAHMIQFTIRIALSLLVG